jgi:hypothetical protein
VGSYYLREGGVRAMKKPYLRIYVVPTSNSFLVVARIPAVELVLAEFKTYKKAMRSAKSIEKALGKDTKGPIGPVPYHPLGAYIDRAITED